jgi:hypothetical protein
MRISIPMWRVRHTSTLDRTGDGGVLLVRLSHGVANRQQCNGLIKTASSRRMNSCTVQRRVSPSVAGVARGRRRRRRYVQTAVTASSTSSSTSSTSSTSATSIAATEATLRSNSAYLIGKPGVSAFTRRGMGRGGFGMGFGGAMRGGMGDGFRVTSGMAPGSGPVMIANPMF